MIRSATFLQFRRIGPRLAVASVAGLLLAALALGIYNERDYREQKIDEGGVRAQILASAVDAALTFDDRNAAQEYVNALAVDPEVRVAAVYDAAGALFAAYTRGDAVPAEPQTGSAQLEDARVTIWRTVTQGNSAIGTVYLEDAVETLPRRLTRYGVIAVLFIMGSLVVAVMGVAQRALNRANDSLEQRAAELQTEIAERTKVEATLRQSQKMEAIGQLSGGIAHDFNNLLTVIRGNLELLERRIGQGRTDVGRYITFAMDGLTRATNLTQRILAFSRRQPLSPKPVNLSRLTEGMSDLLRHSVGEGVAVQIRVAADWWSLCDENQMENVLLNLAINARDAMPKGGTLTIETENLRIERPLPRYEGAAPGDYVRLSVIDTGIGMSEEVRRQAIDPFFTTKPLGQGTGLGLSMIYGYVNQSGGHLYIESQPGAGTTITILMTRSRAGSAAEAEAMPDAAESEPVAVTKRSKVLVVEDEEMVRSMVVEAVRERGYEVMERGDGNSARDVLESKAEIDLLISDVRLPGMNGFRLAEIGKLSRPGLKILLMTGFSQDPMPKSLSEAGVTIIYKPFRIDDLIANTNRLLADSD